jgi:hypothetical protein
VTPWLVGKYRPALASRWRREPEGGSVGIIVRVEGGRDGLVEKPTENPVHIHDLNATILHQLGIDHEKLTYRFQGRDFRLTDVHGKVVKDILA